MSNRLALLIGAPHGRETAMRNDAVAIRAALRERGLPPEQILELVGQLDRDRLLAFLQAAGQLIGAWQEGELFVLYSGHGAFWPRTVEAARPALELRANPDPDRPNLAHWLFWDEVWQALAAPPAVRITLLPDC